MCFGGWGGTVSLYIIFGLCFMSALRFTAVFHSHSHLDTKLKSVVKFSAIMLTFYHTLTCSDVINVDSSLIL